jgi:hypothetical protein
MPALGVSSLTWAAWQQCLRPIYLTPAYFQLMANFSRLVAAFLGHDARSKPLPTIADIRALGHVPGFVSECTKRPRHRSMRVEFDALHLPTSDLYRQFMANPPARLYVLGMTEPKQQTSTAPVTPAGLQIEPAKNTAAEIARMLVDEIKEPGKLHQIASLVIDGAKAKEAAVRRRLGPGERGAIKPASKLLWKIARGEDRFDMTERWFPKAVGAP